MPRMVGLALAGLLAGACGHEQTTGSAQNGWQTPVGYATATNPRYINPLAAAHPARDRTVFQEQQAPPQQPVSSDEAMTPPPSETTAPPPSETMPPPEKTSPEMMPPGTMAPDEVPPEEMSP
ncbi:MAG: hypothetical protein JWM53_1141 [bacterium]|nr:hypothetical protein [bacterium]